MDASLILDYLLLWSLIGIVAFSLIVVYLFRSGKVFDARTEEGHLKEKMPRKGFLNMLIFLLIVVSFMTLTNYLSLISQGISPKFWSLFCINLALIIILIMYDTLVIDWWVIGFWRPAFLKLPEKMDREQMKEHIRRTFIVAPLYAVLLAALSAGITTFLW